MPWVPQKAPLTLTPDERKHLQELANSRTTPFREVQRASILLSYADGIALRRIAQEQGVTRMTVDKCLKKALSMGVAAGLKDLYHRPKDPVITPEAKAWVVSLACTKPVDLGMAAEIWTRSALASYVRSHAEEVGHPSLSKAAKATVHRILSEQELAPHKVTYYLERKDPEFDRKMREVLMVYREIAVDTQDSGPRPVYTVSVDEKPGVQALGLVSPDLPPVPSEHTSISRDYEYVRLGTLSILAALDLHNGHVTARVEERHRSQEFVSLLKDLDAHYPPDAKIRIILDNHSAHVSQETRAYLATRPNRFEYVHTPKHGSWLNLVETLFSKMSRTFLRHIRVTSVAELKKRIKKGIAEINADPVVHRWKNFDFAEQK